MKNIRIVFLTIVAVMLSISLLYAGESAHVGGPIPKIILHDVQTGEIKYLNEVIYGKVTVIVYMQTSCAACRKELENLKSMLDDFPDLNVIAISVDAGSPKRIKKYIKHYKFPFTFLHDPTFSTPEYFGFSYTPAIVVLDKCGNITYLSGGYRRGDERSLHRVVQDTFAKKCSMEKTSAFLLSLDDRLFHAVYTSDTKMVRELIERGANVNGKTNGKSALMWGAWKGAADVVKLLIDNGADINDKGSNG